MDCAQQESFCLQEVIIHAASYHTNRSRDFNEFNPGVGLHVSLPDLPFYAAAGVYRNSLYSTSVYAGIGKDFALGGPFSFRLTAGAVTGYEVPVAPALLPELVISGAHYGVSIGYMPKLAIGDKTVEAVFTFSILKRF